jgi:hypothetical protein
MAFQINLNKIFLGFNCSIIRTVSNYLTIHLCIHMHFNILVFIGVLFHLFILVLTLI